MFKPFSNSSSTTTPPPPPTFGMLIVGLGGNNGVTMLAGLRANQQNLEWETPTGKVKANYYGCITQLPMKGGKGGYKEQYTLADANRGAIGGWDIRPKPLGDALYESHVLDYDLVRQVREQLNKIDILKGIWNPSFIGESQHATATHVVDHTTTTHAQSLQILRGDIQKFRASNNIPPEGHITVIWSASVERPCMQEFPTAASLLSAIETNHPEVSPSLLYAVAAVLEGCSFVNGGSQNTLCPGLEELAHAQTHTQTQTQTQPTNKCYVLGTDFKAGQTKFKTAAVEYLRALGLKPTVIASSNHLGNNDMLNLTSKKTLDAKMRVKNDIFTGWEEEIDHQVRVMYTPYIGDEKRDIVEYTSLGFLGSPHTMLTYTRCMDSILCVPLMIDAAVWCDYFSRHHIAPAQVVLATAYLFKVPEGGAKGCDPGFFHQMDMLERVLEGTVATSGMPSALKKLLVTQAAKNVEGGGGGGGGGGGEGGGGGGGVGGEGDEPLLGAIVCVGLSCLDLMLVGASGEGETFGAINTFSKQVFCPGGSAPQSSLALAEMLSGMPGSVGVGGARRKRQSVVKLLTKVGVDVHGDELLRQLEDAGVDTSLVIRDGVQSTSLAVLPILASTGARGCFVNLQANDSFTPTEALQALKKGQQEGGNSTGTGGGAAPAALHFGYPHLMKNFQGANLKEFFTAAAAAAAAASGGSGAGGGGGGGGRTLLLSMDLNGVTSVNNSPAVLAEALPMTDVLHLNQEEANLLLADTDIHLSDAAISLSSLQQAGEALLTKGLAIVTLTLGEHGAYVKVTSNEKRLQACDNLSWQAAKWAGQETLLPPYPLQPGAEANTNGAGDSFIAGFLAAMLCKTKALSLKQATSFALLTARERVDSLKRASPTKASYAELLAEAMKVI